LYQVVFHAQMAAEEDQFGFVDVVNAISSKLVRRHPHVFAGKKITGETKLYYAWENHKKEERAQKNHLTGGGQAKSYLDGVANTMSALRWSDKLQKRSAHHGFDWQSIDPVFDKLQEDIAELKAEIATGSSQQRIMDEMGDILFASVNLSRHLGVNPEQALRDTNRKFITRFEIVEQLLREDNKQMEDCSVTALEDYWQKAKRIYHGDTENAE